MIKELLEPFSFSLGQLQDIVTLFKQLEKHGNTIEDLSVYLYQTRLRYKNFVEENQERTQRLKDDWERKALRCPECNIIMSLSPVNTSNRDQTGDNSRSVWYCSKCHYEQFNIDSIQELTKG